jgi:hypothetical protein
MRTNTTQVDPSVRIHGSIVAAVAVALPGSFPMWMKAEQSLGGLFLLGVVALANTPHRPHPLQQGRRNPGVRTPLVRRTPSVP